MSALAWDSSRLIHPEVSRGSECLSPRVADELEIVASTERLLALRPEWEALYQQSDPRNAFTSHAWTVACWMEQQGRSQLFVATLREDGRLVAVAPLCIEGRAGFRILRFIADNRSDYLGFLCVANRPDLENALTDALCSKRGDWDIAVLRQLTEAYSSLHAIHPPGFAVHDVEWTTAPYCASDGDWETLHLEGPTWLKRTRKRLRRFLNDGWKIEKFTGQEAAARLDQVSRIEAKSWKGRDGATRLQPGAGQDLLRHAFSNDADAQMELWLASIDGKPVAFQIDFLLPGRLWIYQQAYDEDYRRTSAGSFMGYLSVQSAWRDGVREYDYLSGEEPYKLERTNASRAIHYFALHRRTLRGWLAYGLLFAPRWRLRKVPTFRALYATGQGLKRLLAPNSNA